MIARNKYKLRAETVLFIVICLIPLCGIWIQLPQSATLVSLGILFWVGSFGLEWLGRDRAKVPEGVDQNISKVDYDRSVEIISPIVVPALAGNSPQSSAITNAFSIDLEDYFHTEVAGKVVHYDAWDAMPSRIERSTLDLLDILDQSGTRATVFVLGWVARKQPKLIRDIQRRGHEVACHSDRHRRVSTLTPNEFVEDTRIARDAIQDAGGVRIQGYRAPSFSIVEGTEWAFDILAEIGFTYDSSIYPVYHPTYGNPNAMRFPYYVADCKLLEIPVATWRVCGINLPVGGGAYLRILPESYIRAGLRAINQVDREPAMVYIHPWEIDPVQPRLKLNISSQLRQTSGLNTMATKLERLLRDQRFGPIGEVYAQLIPQWNAEFSQSSPTNVVEVNV